MKNQFSLLVAFSFLALTPAVFSAVTNGFFDDGINGWSFNGNENELVSVEDGGAKLFPGLLGAPEDPLPPSSSFLRQTFDFESFDMLSFSFLPSIEGEGPEETDHFYVSLLSSSTNTPLASVLGQEYFFHWDSSLNVEAADGVTVSGPTTSDPLYHIELALLPNQIPAGNVDLSFVLNHDYVDGRDTSVLIDGVQLSTAPTVVPVPGAVFLSFVGCAAVGLCRRKLGVLK